MSRNKKIIFVHGCGPKPQLGPLHEIWRDAVVAGLQRDLPDHVEAFENVPSQFLYFADQVTEFVRPEYDHDLDVANRRQALQQLVGLSKSRNFRRRNYDELPGKTARKEFFMDAGASLGLSGLVIKRKLPELHDYLRGAQWGQEVRSNVTQQVRAALEQDEDVLLIGHCLGSVIAYDALWSLSRELEISQRISAFVTLGSPLTDQYVQRKLQGSDKRGVERYPNNLTNWHNLSAEDDYVCHDKTAANDFQAMLDHRMVSDIADHTIYNLAVRYGRSNAHSSVGYLIHPRMTQIVGAWLKG